MNDRVKRIAALIYKYRLNELTDEERQELQAWRDESPFNEDRFQSLIDSRLRMEELEMYKKGELEQAEGWQKILALGLPARKISPVRKMVKWTAAAAAVIILAFGAYYVSVKENTLKQTAKAPAPKQDLLPGGDKAILTLSNGETIALDAAADGKLAQQGSTKVIKVGNGLSYQVEDKPAAGQVYYNMVKVPRGGQYSLTLSDGTKIWLNSASTLRFPTAFNGKERVVQVTGEAYLEVAKNPLMPFIVETSKGGRIQVLGTHFDVMAYDDEPETRTTLLEGAVKVSSGANTALLSPGQQARVINGSTGKIDVVKDADLDEALAWKNGVFVFKKATIETIGRQLSRWYNVDIEYKEPVNKFFYAEIPRNSKVSAVFEVLQATGGVHFEVEGKKIVVTQ